MYSTRAINNFEVEPVKIDETPKENILGYDMFPILYNNIFCIAKKKSGKSNVIYNILAHGSEQLSQDGTLRHQTIEALIDYFRLHINESFDLKSREVLWQVMKG